MFAERAALAATVLVAGLAACAPTEPPAFHHHLAEGPTPWSSEPTGDRGETFTFAVFSDLNGGEREGVFAVAAAQLALLQPDLVMSVGDLIDGPVDEPSALTAEWDSFDERAAVIGAPVFHVGGNHDLTGQVLRDVWSERFGAHWYHFVYRDVLFIALDTEDNTPARAQEIFEARTEAIRVLDAGGDASDMEYYRIPERVTGNIGPEQSAYVLAAIAEHPDVRWTFLFMHKPVWTDDADPEFVAIENALADRPYTVFNGHFHVMSHRVKNERDYIMLGTTGGSQNAANPMAFDHVTLVTVGEGEPAIAHLRLDGILERDGTIPAGGGELCFQASACGAGGG